MKFCGKLLINKNISVVRKRFTHDWIAPEGFDSGIKLYNCITKNKEPLILQNKHLIKWYSCGPTVYDASHIGHASCFVNLDIIQKVLKDYFKYNLITVMSITDIENRVIRKANQTKTTCKDVAEKYEKLFWIDLKDLGVAEPDIIARVTDNMDIIIDFIKKLENDGHAYKAKNNQVYFNIVSYKKYGKLENLQKEEIEKGGNDIKKSLVDFVLWKTRREGEPFWNSPWGDGRPGWHIECSALASHILGSNIDIHAGGLDLRFPHHENEEAQSCTYHNISQWVNYWLHTGLLHQKNCKKMSKSLNNTISIQDMLKSSSPEIFRMACLMSSYRSNMEYSEELLLTAKNNLKTYKNFMDSCDAYKKGILKSSINSEVLNTALNKSSEEIHKALCDDFDTPRVMKILNELVSVSNSMLYTSASSTQTKHDLASISSVQNAVKKLLNLVGINFDVKSAKTEDHVHVMDILNNFQQNVREIGETNTNSDILNLCDDVSEDIKKLDISMKDLGAASSLRM